ncbi:MAG: cupin domain-containing protein [Balneolaceae bacterium]|nr:cupin domain-containing protein [Balneolaceae bacterium]
MKAQATITGSSDSAKKSEAIVGDILLLYPGEMMQTDVDIGLLVFKVPVEAEKILPSFIRPDWDPNITDIPGGCATEIDAYRRILLTWKKDVGEYIYHGLNAHRVRMYDSFSHYHPKNGGFDEFYLVQMVKTGAKIITSEKVDQITSPDSVKKSQVDGLVDEYELEVGDLVYLPRGVMHRGYGGVLAQVITVPGFIPGSEIGVDHYLRAINERIGLQEDETLPYNEEHSHEAIVR